MKDQTGLPAIIPKEQKDGLRNDGHGKTSSAFSIVDKGVQSMHSPCATIDQQPAFLIREVDV